MTLPLQVGPAWGLLGNFDDTNVRGTLAQGGSSGVKGSWNQLIASVPYECCGFYLSIHYRDSIDYLCDLGVGASGAEAVLVGNILGCGRTTDANAHGIYFPVRLRAGVRMAARTQGSSSSGNAYYGLTLFRGGPDVVSASRVVQYGAIASSRGVPVAASSSANTFGSWTEIVAAASMVDDIAGLLVNISQNGGTKSNTFQRWQIGVGASGSEQVVLEWGCAVLSGIGVTMDRGTGMGVLPVRIKAGSRIAVRLMNVSAIATAANRTHDVVLHGIVP
jgi:hypothetical protein